MKSFKIIIKNRELKRLFRKLRSKLKKRIKNGARLNNKTLRKYHLNINTHNKSHKKIKHSNNWRTLKIPRIFCFISDHESVFQFFKYFNNIFDSKKPKNIHIDHTETEEIGLSASYIFDMMINVYLRKWRDKKYSIEIKGITSNIRDINNFLLSFGLLSKYKFADPMPEGFVDPDYKLKYETFKYSGSSNYSYLKGNAASGLSEYFKKCLKYNNYILSDEGQAFLADVFGEIIGNAEEHSSKDSGEVFWNVLGCYNKDTSYCSFSIINYGNTIYESLSNPNSTSAEVIKSVNDIINSNKSYLGQIKELFTKDHEEPIWNAMALQDGISSKRTLKGKASTRGQGLMDVIDFIGNLKSEKDLAQIVMISGKSKILIDYEYRIQYKEVGSNNEKRRQIIFNKENMLHEPPDRNKVILMPDSFSGTIISGRFKLNEKYLLERVCNNEC
jgi:hypothetical protein